MLPADPLLASRSTRIRVGVGAAAILVIVGVAIAVLVAALGAGAGQREYVASTLSTAASGATNPAGRPNAGALQSDVGARGGDASPGAEIYVHLLGAVNRPGLYTFREGDRAIDAVAAAGGYAEDADRRSVNLARFLSDGEQILVPTQTETASGAAPNTAASVANGGKINLNTADAAALETLPRVGPALAARILAWRIENGRFASIEDLMSVSGIGEKTFAGLKDLVTV